MASAGIFSRSSTISIKDFKRLEAEARQHCNKFRLNEALHCYVDLLHFLQVGRVEANGDFIGKYQSEICFRIGLIYEAQGRYEDAIIYFRKSIHFFQECRSNAAYFGNEREKRQITINLIQAAIKVAEILIVRGQGKAAYNILCAARKELEILSTRSPHNGVVSQLENRITWNMDTISRVKYNESAVSVDKNILYSAGLSEEEIEDALLCYLHERADKEVTLWISPFLYLGTVITRVIDLFSDDIYQSLDEMIFGEGKETHCYDRAYFERHHRNNIYLRRGR